MNTNTMQPPPFILPASKGHEAALEALSNAVLALDAAFEQLPTEAFMALPDAYKELADSVLRCYWGEVEEPVEVPARRS
jgi:hypothetical protein